MRFITTKANYLLNPCPPIFYSLSALFLITEYVNFAVCSWFHVCFAVQSLVALFVVYKLY